MVRQKRGRDSALLGKKRPVEEVVEEKSSEESDSDSSSSSSSSSGSSSDSDPDSDEEVSKKDNINEAKGPNKQEQVVTVKTAKEKVLPPGYVCNACGAVGQHAIYDCPNKVTAKEKGKKNTKSDKGSAEKVAKSDKSSAEKAATEEGTEEDSSASLTKKQERKKDKSKYEKRDYKYSAFISGLPFSSTRDSICKVLLDNIEGEVTIKPRDVVVLTFPDNPQRCKGLAYVNFADEDEYKKCLALGGIDVEGKTLTIVESNIPTKAKSTAGKKKKKDTIKRCYRCGKAGHEPKDCKNAKVCYKCLATDHISKNCPKKQKTN